MTATDQKLPTVPQMANRCLPVHFSVLANLAAGQPAFVDTFPIPEAAMASEMRGRRKVLDTLRRWECVQDGRITERGRALLAAKR